MKMIAMITMIQPFKSDDNNEESLASENHCCQRMEQTGEEKRIPENYLFYFYGNFLFIFLFISYICFIGCE